MTYPLRGRVAIVTGGSQGLGLAISKAYVTAGASLLLCARSVDGVQQAVEDLTRLVGQDQRVVGVVADVAKQSDVQRVVDRALEEFDRIQILVNNAGVYGPKGRVEEVDWTEWVQAIQTNLLGSVLACRAILPHFKSHRYGKIVQLSGGGATNPLPRISAYAASKAAIVRFAETLAEEVRRDGIDVNAIAPGALNTRLLDEVMEAGPEKVGQDFYDRSLKQHAAGGTPLRKGAELAVFFGSAESDGITGKLISAVWDRWEDLPKHVDELRNSEVYTLRRIVPKDRGLFWGDR